MTVVVTVEKTSTVSVTRAEPQVTPVVETTAVTAVTAEAPRVSEIERPSGVLDAILAGQLGPRGPQGEKGDPGDINGTTDQLAEGASNLYFTHERAEAVAESVTTAQVGLHLAHPDPHPQYLADSETLDGGNF